MLIYCFIFRNKEGKTPAMIVYETYPDCPNWQRVLMKFLTQNGAYLNILNNNGESLLSNFYVKMLLHTARPERLLQDPVFIHNVDVRLSKIQDVEGSTPLGNISQYLSGGLRQIKWAAFLYIVGFHLGKIPLETKTDIVQSYPEAEHWLEWLKEVSALPRSLQELCRLEVLGNLSHFDVTGKIGNLPLPQNMKYFLTIRGILEWSRIKGTLTLDADWDESYFQELEFAYHTRA